MTVPLNYASSASGRLTLLRSALGLCAIGGLLANIGLVLVEILNCRFGLRAYRDLSLNSRAYGRVITAEEISSLRRPWWLWSAEGAAVGAALVGICLAFYLLLAVIRFGRAPEAAMEQMGHYHRWKIPATAFTGVTTLWASFANFRLVNTATHHISVGSWNPITLPLLVVTGALVPWWLIGSRINASPFRS